MSSLADSTLEDLEDDDIKTKIMDLGEELDTGAEADSTFGGAAARLMQKAGGARSRRSSRKSRSKRSKKHSTFSTQTVQERSISKS